MDTLLNFELNKVIKHDLKITDDLVQSKHRISIANNFLTNFLSNTRESSSPKSFNSMQIYQESSSEFVHRSIPNIWGNELASGRAVFIGDLPPYEGKDTNKHTSK